MRNVFASLTSRLVVTAVALVAVVVLLIGAAATLALHSYLSHRLDDDVASSLGRYRPGARTLGPPDADDRQFNVIREGSVTAAATSNGSLGEVMTDYRDRALTTEQVAALTSVPADGAAHDVAVPGLGEYRVAAARGQYSLAGGPAGPGVVAVGLPTSTVDGPISQLIAWEVAFGLLGVAAAAGAGTYVVRRQLRPLREVASTAHTVARLPLAEEIAIAPRVPEHLTDERTEVGQVGSALNSLLVHVERSLVERHRSEQQVRQFVADASHELRTPLTTIAGYTELARRRPDESGAVTTALAKVEEESARMTSIVEDLLLLARLDAGRPLARDTVDLSRLLVEAVSDARVVAPDHAWRLDLPEESLEVTGDADRLHQVVTNLLTNARKHTPAGTTVTVTGTHTGTDYAFSVHDDGPGFPGDLAGTAFERFVRGDASRTRTGDTTVDGAAAPEGGAGLGLSLVEAIVTAHGGSVSLDSRPGSTTITVSLPG
ncbi:MAG TPA: HAMP domain-containing sensor histidine kinase [Nocardioides sp.]|uniref:sensor histidine kinase n=1 Tax=Nocardioides sp. TaxID=35761 RepID=UPI002F3FBEB7